MAVKILLQPGVNRSDPGIHGSFAHKKSGTTQAMQTW